MKKSKHFVPLVFLCIVPIFLAACYKLHPMAFLPKDLPSPVSTANRINQINVTTSNEGDIDSSFNTDAYQIALERILKKADLFTSDNLNGFKLEANVTKFSAFSAGFEMSATLDVKYRLSDKFGRVLFVEEIKAEGKAPFSEAFRGAQRSYNVWDRVRQNHMSLLVGKLGMVLAQ